MNKKALSERDICTKFITPALVKAGWDVQTREALLRQCDRLESRLLQIRTHGAHLLAASLHHLIAA